MRDVNKQKFLDDLGRRLGGDPTCPVCRGASMMVADKVLEVDIHVPMHERRVDITSEALSVVAVSCIQCGHVMLFNTHMVDC